jgi:hypothetical protein
MATLARSNATLAGVALGAVAATAGGDVLPNDGNTLLYIKNGGASPITVTIDSIKLSNFGTDVNPAVTVAAAAEMVIGPFPVARFGRVPAITYTGVTSVTVAAIANAS